MRERTGSRRALECPAIGLPCPGVTVTGDAEHRHVAMVVKPGRCRIKL
jgi:hypothetical protein